MRIYRLTASRYVATAFSGEGTRRVGGRWVPVGYPIVHASTSIALAVLETLVHVDSSVMPAHRVIAVDIPEAVPVTATWLFSSAANRDLFASDPEAYAPEFGGWCAYALSQGRYAAEVEPANAWTVRDGRLYLNWNASVRERWLGNDVANGIHVGERNWELVMEDILEGDANYSRKSNSPWNAL